MVEAVDVAECVAVVVAEVAAFIWDVAAVSSKDENNGGFGGNTAVIY